MPHLCRAAALVAALCLSAAPVTAQVPEIDRNFVGSTNPLDGDSIRFCVYPASPIGESDRTLAGLLGDILLLETEIVEVAPPIAIEGLDTIPISLDDLFLLLSNECDAFLGLELAADVYPNWLTLTRPYLSAPYVVVARDGAYGSIADLAPDAGVATQSLTTGDIRFSTWRRAQPEDQQVRRRPYPHVVLQLERVRDGTEEAALIWQPWLTSDRIDTEGFAVIDSAGNDFGTRAIGIGLRSRDTFLRGALDDAIAALEADGTLADLYAD